MTVTVDVLGNGTGLNGDFELVDAMDASTNEDTDAAGNCFSTLGQTNTEIKVQGTASVPFQAKSVTNQFGFAGSYSSGRNTDMSNKHAYSWVRTLDPFQIEGYNTDEGIIMRLADSANGASPYEQHEVGGMDTRRATVEGFIRLCVDVERTPDESAGTLTKTAVDGIYIGGTMVSGSGQNTYFVDAFHVGSFFRVYGGTSGAKGTSKEIAAVTDVYEAGVFKEIEDDTMFILAGMKFGDNGTGSSYFKDTGGSWVFESQNVAADHYAIIVEGNATGTNSFELGEITGTGKNTTGTGGKTMQAGQEAFHIDMTDADVDTAIMAGCNLLNAGTTSGTIDITNADAVFVSNLASECSTITLDNSPLVVNNTIVDSVVASTDAAIDLGTSKPSANTFANNIASGGNAHGLRISGTSTTGDTWDLDNIVLSDFSTADILVDYPAQTSGKVTINLNNGSAANSTTQVAVTGGIALADVVLAQSVSVSVTVTFEGSPVEGAAVYLKTLGGTEVLNGLTNASGVISGSFAGTTPAGIDTTVSGVKASSGSTPYTYYTLGGTIESGTGYSTTALLSED